MIKLRMHCRRHQTRDLLTQDIEFTMSLEKYIGSIPKIDLHLQLEGAMERSTLLTIADQNEIRDQQKRFDKWVEQYRNPDFKKLDDLTEVLRSWMQFKDDLVRAVYDVGVKLSKENVRYAEIGINPLSFVNGDFTFEALLNALNDGRDRVNRAWGVQLQWIIFIPRNDPRKADEVARWATSATARKNGVVGLTLAGQTTKRGVGLDQFERAFKIAEKKGLSRIAHMTPRDDVEEAISTLNLNVVVDAWGISNSPDTLRYMKDENVTLCVGMNRVLKYGWSDTLTDYPLQQIIESGVSMTLSAIMPTIFESNITDEYLLALDNDLLNLEQLEAIAINAIALSHLSDEDKTQRLTEFQASYELLRAEHLSTAN